jgi:hypothetical protein
MTSLTPTGLRSRRWLTDLTSGARDGRPANRMVNMRLLAVLGFTILVLLRIPQVVTSGRFWAEEGVVYFRAAWEEPWLDALFKIHTGYLNMAASAATLLALHLVPLERAPLVTAAFAGVIQILPAVLLATGRVVWLERWPALVLALCLVLIPIGDGEVWLNSITSQFHLALCVGLILALDARRGWGGVGYGAILLIAPLVGPVCGTLTPLFLIRAGVERSWRRLVQAVLLGLPTLLQAVIVLTHPEPSRAMGIGMPLLVVVIAVENVILPLVGLQWAQTVADLAKTSFQNGGMALRVALVGVVGLGGLGVAVYRTGDRTAWWMFVAGGTLAAASYSAALTLGQPLNLLVWIGNRYSFAPSVLLGLSLLGLAATGGTIRRAVVGAVVVWMIAIAAGPYFRVPDIFGHGPNWRAEVAAWRRDPSTELRIWPLGWRVPLDRAMRSGF